MRSINHLIHRFTKTTMKAGAMAANRRLAELRGWTKIVAAAGALLGEPPAGAPECRGQALVPDWCGDWRHAGALLAEYRMGLGHSELEAFAGAIGFQRGAVSQYVGAHGCRETAMRSAIVQAVIYHLEAQG